MTATAQTKMRMVFLPLRVVPEYKRIVVFRLGKMVGMRGPGVKALVPFVDRVSTVDLREFYLEIPKQTAITKDNAPIAIDFITFFKVVDAEASVVQVADFAGAGPERRGDDASFRGGRHHSRQHPRPTRRDQPGAPREARRGHRAMGRQGHHRRDP